MTPERQSERGRMRRRAWILLAVYALFVALPAAHLVLHHHGSGGWAPIGPSGPPSLMAACDQGCDNPFHHHDAHRDEACAVCQTLGATKGLPQLGTPACLAPNPLTTVAPADDRLCLAPEARVPLARGPPAAPTPRFESIVA